LERGADQQTVSYISVSSVNGVVTLAGEVPSKRAKSKAGEIARTVEGVVSVNNNLSIAPGYSDDAVGDKP
jgi:osmotically-inducible protein OsmY